MLYSYVFPTIVTLPLGYRAIVIPPIEQVRERLAVPDADVLINLTRYAEGQATTVGSYTLPYRAGRYDGPDVPPFEISDPRSDGLSHPGYLEIETVHPNGENVFQSKRVFGLYTVFTGENRASFLSDNAYKYGSPPIISQMARFKTFVQTYPVIRVDRQKGFGESLTLINPYKMALVASIVTEDGRKLKRRKIPPQSARNWDLSEILREGEAEWSGQIQLTANNRVITFNFKHAFGDQERISDYEHLDPFREDPTHMPLSVLLRQRIGGWLISKNR